MNHTQIEDFTHIASDWIWETDEAGRFTRLSPEAETFLGRPVAELLGVDRSAFAWEFEAGGLHLYRAALAARRAFRDLTYIYSHPDGAPRWFEISGRPCFSADGAFAGYRGVGCDVSEQRRTRDALVEAHAELTEQNRRFDAALENMSQGLCLFDARHRLQVWNRRYLDMFGLEPDALQVGMSQQAIIEQLVALGRYRAGMTVDSVSEGTRTSLTADGPKALMRELADGRVIAVTHRAMPGGGWVSTFEDVTERRRNEARIVHMARHDGLTDLPNRTALREIGIERLGQAREAGAGLAVLCLDLDRFKPVNDSFGHAVGDGLLKAVSARLRAQVRGRDVVARLGGDEFAVLYAVADADDATAVAERLIGAVSAPYRLDGVTAEIGMSVGIALALPEAGGTGDIERLLKEADMALYEAKAAGRGTFRLFEPKMDETVRERIALERELREALQVGRFEVHYQPLVDLSDDRITGMEALVRWRHPERGLVSPAVFIPLAEETGLIVPLGEWVLRQACRDAAGWPGDTSVAVNVSPLQLRHRGFAQTVVAALAATGLAAARLELEITESVLLDDTEANLETLHGLRGLGVRISMDDFGTGYSSISYLRRFPFDKIKIDRSFVRDCAASPDAGAIIRAIVGLGASLGITTLVEGVETEPQLAAVRAEGAREVQGFLFSPPRPAAEAAALLAAQDEQAATIAA
ncbi:diguanylate cyclase [Methylobacterium sp. Leaf456]|uniref:putative bifunctional diguanylate cyclase/phosphodiesterase n=1 Tax=Methylobacterium sp. Leaf456 TaxID=1736382 RepID=UPI0006F4326F|nr:EAL domain-containing protein [Methylobacterium sp. Leaf456]KQT60144.1 diguanylate cyclase [Methylobacterium sp. Leaf456]